MSARMHWSSVGELDVLGPDGLPNIKALSREHMQVAFQPIVDTRTGRLVAYEALARCREPAFANPSTLFARAVEQQACGRLGRLIREVAFAECTDQALFINVHPAELESRWLVRPDDPMGFHDRDVFLEITESAAFHHFDLCQGVLREVCQRLGASLVVDDFGAGYSNLLRVLELSPAVVKLDGALVRGLHEDRRKQSLVAHMVALCADLGALVVAECVETIEELHAARDCGVSYVQGYLTGRPAFPPPTVTWPLDEPAPKARKTRAAPVKLKSIGRTKPTKRPRRKRSSAPKS